MWQQQKLQQLDLPKALDLIAVLPFCVRHGFEYIAYTSLECVFLCALASMHIFEFRRAPQRNI